MVWTETILIAQMCSFALWGDFYLIKGEQEEKAKICDYGYLWVCVCVWQSKRSVHVISISQSCCENKMATLPDCREGILQRQHIAKRTKASLRYGCVRHTVNAKASYHFLLK